MNTIVSLQTSSPSLDAQSDPRMTQSQSCPKPVDDLSRALNTALLSSRDQPSRDWLAEIQRLMDSPAYSSLLSSIRLLARTQGVSEAAAAEEMIRTVRALDSAWRDYAFQEGLDRIKSSG
ncbi:MAG: hypothetical protein KGQ59_03745 [Bdellovibrionales bacterium]|nr:hypothetical protein [Bdellovibrionales bacterium]